MGDDGELCDTVLGLGIGVDANYMPKFNNSQEKKSVSLDFSFPDHPSEEVVDIEPKGINIGNNNNDNCSRKKLKLTKEQSTLLEESFNSHNTLNSSQKQILAEKLDLKPRQVEVWFQNRRARTKLKQTERDCEYMKKCCQSLSDENRRLKKELQELLELKLRPLYIQLPKAVAASTLKTCSSCSRGKADNMTNSTIKNVKEEGDEEEEEDDDAKSEATDMV